MACYLGCSYERQQQKLLDFMSAGSALSRPAVTEEGRKFLFGPAATIQNLGAAAEHNSN